jgi:hypothetical protein
MIGSGLISIQVFMNKERFFMATTGELRAIIEKLQMVDIGDAASYLGEEVTRTEEAIDTEDQVTVPIPIAIHQPTGADLHGDTAPLR